MTRFDEDMLRALADEREVQVRTRRRDGSQTDLPIWVVVADGEAYVRSVRGDVGRWYRRAREEGRMTLVTSGRPTEVVVEPVTDAELNERVSQAFATKYGLAGPGERMAHEVTDTTLRLSPAQ